jgi:hypothetical protein
MATFWNTGYITIHDFMDDDEVKLLRREIAQVQESLWFARTHDPNRREAIIDIEDSAPAAFRLVHERFVEVISNAHKGWSVLERIKLVQSLPKARGEFLHRDFESSETAAAIINTEWVQATLLLVLDPDTKLLVVPAGYGGAPEFVRCTALQDLTAGDIVVYRGDLPHADPPYEDGNIRIEGCVNVDGIDHEERMVERVPWVRYRCEFCFKSCDD